MNGLVNKGERSAKQLRSDVINALTCVSCLQQLVDKAEEKEQEATVLSCQLRRSAVKNRLKSFENC